MPSTLPAPVSARHLLRSEDCRAFRGPLVIALAGLADDIDVTTTISIRRRTA